MIVEQALKLADQGFYVFPLKPGTKLPAITDYTNKATRLKSEIKRWWAMRPYPNIGIITSKFGDSEALIVVDVDVKGKHNGFDSVRALEHQGFKFPETLTQDTPSGGCHLIFRNPAPVRQSVGAIGRGIDIRSRGGYIVGPGSQISGKTYTLRDGDLRLAPTWLIERCSATNINDPANALECQKIIRSFNSKHSVDRALHYLEHQAPHAQEGQGGDTVTFQVAAKLKDLGLNEDKCWQLMLNWNEKCQPPWTPEELLIKVRNAYKYGENEVGSEASETVFADVVGEPDIPEEGIADEPPEGPMAKLNSEYAFVIAGGGHHIIWETKDAKGNHHLAHLNELTFHRKHASDTIQVGDGKPEPVTKLWMRSKQRRSYDGFVFRPEQETPANLYNLWRGFAVKPCEGEPNHESLAMFLEHARENVCGGDEKLFRWLIGYFAHLIQKPWEKPLTALVFRGKKGVGKNALVDRIGHLLGGHYLSTPDRRYLVGNFNGHLENCLLFTLDEAFWSGDKQAEGVLKSVITGQTHNIEHKGKEIYSVDNCTRVVILGNENWLVPATHDERRYAVFQVGDGRKQDRAFFEQMRVGMEKGGYAHLLKYLQAFNLSGLEINEAPKTKALLEQKEESLEPVDAWWLNCLKDGQISEDVEWPQEIPCSTVRHSFIQYCREKQIRSRLPDTRVFGRRLHDLAGEALHRNRKREGAELLNMYKFPTLLEARTAWDKHIGHQTDWE